MVLLHFATLHTSRPSSSVSGCCRNRPIETIIIDYNESLIEKLTCSNNEHTSKNCEQQSLHHACNMTGIGKFLKIGSLLCAALPRAAPGGACAHVLCTKVYLAGQSDVKVCTVAAVRNVKSRVELK